MNKKNVILIINNNVDVDAIVAISTYLKKHNIQTTKVALSHDPVVNKQNISVVVDAYLDEINLDEYLAICIPNFCDISTASKNAHLLDVLYKLYLMNRLIISIGNGAKLIKVAFENKNIDVNYLPTDKVLHFDNETNVPNNSSFFKKLLDFLTIGREQIY